MDNDLLRLIADLSMVLIIVVQAIFIYFLTDRLSKQQEKK